MKYDMGCMLVELKDRYVKERVIFASIGGIVVGSTITHSEIVPIISTTIMRAIEFMSWIYQMNMTNIIDSNTSKLIIASASPHAMLVYQKNRGNMGIRKERSRWEIIEDILTILAEERKTKKTRIMQRAFLNWRDFQRYFEFLLEGRFIAECNNPRVGDYELTEKGIELLKKLKEVDNILH